MLNTPRSTQFVDSMALLISVRDGSCDIAIDFTKEEFLSIIENIYTC